MEQKFSKEKKQHNTYWIFDPMNFWIKNKKLRYAIIFLLIAGGGLCAWGYSMLYSSNTAFSEKEQILFIQDETNLSDWLESNESDFIENKSSFSAVSNIKKFNRLKPGRYKIRRGAGNNTIINMLRSGNQSPLTIRIDDTHRLDQLASKLGKNLRSDSAAFMTLFASDDIQKNYGLNYLTLPSLIIPDTYEFFWTMTPDEFLLKMKKVHDNYWTEENKALAQNIGLAPTSVCILASIVKAETAKKQEAPKIAGLYLNRLKIGMALQSDPTAVFGSEEHVARVTGAHLNNDSPYNTYHITGLPPGPIDFCEPVYLDAVLHAEKHNFIFMCAQPGKTGFHNFSKTLDQHNVYRREYLNWLDSKGIQ